MLRELQKSADAGGAVIVCSRRGCGGWEGLGGGGLTVIVVINNKSAHVT